MESKAGFGEFVSGRECVDLKSRSGCDDKTDIDDLIDNLRHAKSRSKAVFSRYRHQLLILIDDIELPSRTKVREAREKLIAIQEKTIDVMDQLESQYTRLNDKESRRKLPGENCLEKCRHWRMNSLRHRIELKVI